MWDHVQEVSASRHPIAFAEERGSQRLDAGPADPRAVASAVSVVDSWGRDAAGIKESQLANALQTLKLRSIILAREGQRGVYRLPSRAYAVWLKARTEAVVAGDG